MSTTPTPNATTTALRNALRARDRDAINRTAAALLDQRTPLGEQWFSVAHVLVRNGEVALALSAAERAVEESGGSASARFHRANVLASIGRHQEALAIVAAIPPAQMNPVQREHFLGTCAMETGDFETARAAFDRVVELWPAAGPTWLSLAALPSADDSALLDRIEAAGPSVKAGTADFQAQWHYARGTVLDRLERTDEAFQAFAVGAQIVRPTRPYDAAADREEAESLAATFDKAAVGEIAGEVGIDTSRVIFVTGLPRSGTTLVEQILTSHSAVAGGGEMPFGSILTREIGGNSLERLRDFVAERSADELARLYLHVGDEHFGGGQRFVDKGLGSSRALGVLASILPQARIVWLRRDPLDCAWSCFRTYFTNGIEWSWSLTDIAAHFQAEDLLHAHWSRVLGDRMLSVGYEELAADPALVVGRILDLLGLDREPVHELMHETDRAVTTASAIQVRQPVNRASVGTAQRYREHLAPFLDAYGPSAS